MGPHAAVTIHYNSGQGVFSPSDRIRLPTASLQFSHQFSDLDSDADTDLILYSDERLSWYENVGGRFDFGGVIADGLPNYQPTIQVADFDNDSDKDIVLVETQGQIYLENQNDGEFTPGRLSTSTFWIGDIAIGDTDDDGDLDIVAVLPFDDVILSFENRLGGDADNDGEVSFLDFLALSSSFGKSIDAVWEDGDFNADGRVDFSDFLVLSQNFGQSRI